MDRLRRQAASTCGRSRSASQPLRVAIKRGTQHAAAAPSVQRHRREPGSSPSRSCARSDQHRSDHLRHSRRRRLAASAISLPAVDDRAAGRAPRRHSWATGRSTWRACRGAAGWRSSSRVSTADRCAASSCWQRRLPARSWCPAARSCCGSWQRRAVYVDRGLLARRSRRRSTAARSGSDPELSARARRRHGGGEPCRLPLPAAGDGGLDEPALALAR